MTQLRLQVGISIGILSTKQQNINKTNCEKTLVHKKTSFRTFKVSIRNQLKVNANANLIPAKYHKCMN